MGRSRERWRKRIVGLISITKRLALVAIGLWPGTSNRKRESLSHEWEDLSVPGPDNRYAGPSVLRHPSIIGGSTTSPVSPNGTKQPYALRETNFPTPSQLVAPSDSLEHNAPEETQDTKRFTLREIPFSFTTQRAPSELPEDVEQLIFGMAARQSPAEALHTLVFVNHRIRKWVEYVIYESVILRDAKHARLFLSALEGKHPEFASGAVKILALPTRVSFDTSLKILTICKDIRHLSWLPTNPLPSEIVDLIVGLPLTSLRARLSSFMGSNPDFSAPLFTGLQTLFVADHQDVWKTWRWDGLRRQPELKWLAFNLDGRLGTSSGWAPVQTLEKTVLKPYGGERGIRLCICYSYNSRGVGDRWIHRSEDTFSEERMAVLVLDHRVDERGWEMRVNGERQDFEISEDLVRQRQTEERRLRFEPDVDSFMHWID